MDDDRELRITSGAIIGVIMLLLAMLPRDIRRDFVSRLNEMTIAQDREEHNASQASTAAELSPVNPGISDGEVIEDPPQHESDTDILSELFEEDH